jgi:signal peptidase
MVKITKAFFLSFIKDIITAVIIILIILSAMYAYARVWPPIVVIESNSMEHKDAGYGRVGTIDAGDFTFVRRIDNYREIVTYYEGSKTGHKTYGAYGDVIIFQKNGLPGTPIIHRAMLWIELNNSKYDVPELGLFGIDAINLPELGLENYRPPHEGFITKGDNNIVCDQQRRDIMPVKPNWIIGVARAEIPWFGAIKLAFDDFMHGTTNSKNVRSDCWVMLSVSIVLLLAVPFGIDYSYPFLKKKLRALPREHKKKESFKEFERLEFKIEKK